MMGWGRSKWWYQHIKYSSSAKNHTPKVACWYVNNPPMLNAIGRITPHDRCLYGSRIPTGKMWKPISPELKIPSTNYTSPCTRIYDSSQALMTHLLQNFDESGTTRGGYISPSTATNTVELFGWWDFPNGHETCKPSGKHCKRVETVHYGPVSTTLDTIFSLVWY